MQKISRGRNWWQSLQELDSKAKKNYKLVKLATKAELCLSRDNAKKIIKKAEKLNKTPLPK